jgi:16S rRNA processing protein RimM
MMTGGGSSSRREAGAAAGMVCVAQVASAHGVRGALKLRTFTEAPENVAAYGPLCDAAGNELLRVRILSQAAGGVIVAADGIADRDAAEALRGLRLYVPRARLPEPEEDEFYVEDLVGLTARGPDGASLGRVAAVVNFGAGDIIELATEGGHSLMVPFTRMTVPEIDLASRTVTVVPPAVVRADGPPTVAEQEQPS